MSQEKNTQLTTISGYEPEGMMIFSDPKDEKVPESEPPVINKRINISTKNEDGTIGDLIISTEECFSFGLAESLSTETKKLTGYSQAICLHDREGPTHAQKIWVEKFNKIVEHAKNYLIENREEIDRFDLDMGDLKKFNPLYWKRDKGKIIEGRGPTVYPKAICSKKNDFKILSAFYDMDSGDTIDIIKHLGKYCKTVTAIKVESIYVSSKISLQLKIYEAEVKFLEGGKKRLLERPNAQTRVLTKKTSPMLEKKKEEEEDNDEGSDTGSLVGEEEEEEEEEKKPVKKVVKRVVRKVKKKE